MAHQLDSDTCSSASSPLRELSRSPTPPDSLTHVLPSVDSHPVKLRQYLPTPPSSQSPHSSQLSSAGSCTPRSDLDHSLHMSDHVDSCPAPKRRRLNRDSPQLPRGTRTLDLPSLTDDLVAGTLSEDEAFAYKSLMRCLKNKRKIVVIAGAGMSVSAGIPDFRSTTGLFKTLKSTHNLKGSGKQLFDASVYRDAQSTSDFHTMVRSMSELSKNAKPTAFHHLIARLAHEDRLLRLYSQNVDGLETSIEPLQTQVPLPRKAPWPRTIQLHGGLEKMVCTKCAQISDFNPDLFDSAVPPACSQCEVQDEIRTVHAGKRSHGVGRLRPRMVLYNEHNPDDEAIGACAKADIRTRPDAVLVVGTSCKVPGVRRIVSEMCRIVRDKRDGLAVWINRDPVPSGKDLEGCWDIIVKGNADDLAQQAGLGRWDDEPVPSVEPLTDSAVKAAKDQGSVNVLIKSPSKETRFFDAVKDAAATETAKATSDVASSDPAKAKVKNPASKGLKLEAYFNKTAGSTQPAPDPKQAAKAPPTAKPPAQRKKPGPKKGATTKAKSSAAKGATTAANALRAQFSATKPAVSKPSATAGQKRKAAAAAAPAAPVPADPPPADAAGPMEGVPEGDARLNSALASPVEPRKPELPTHITLRLPKPAAAA